MMMRRLDDVEKRRVHEFGASGKSKLQDWGS